MNASHSFRTLFVACVLLLTTTSVSAQEYHEIYGKECRYAMDFYHNTSFRDTVIAKSSFPPTFLFSIVAPEVTQYRYLRDVVEQMALFALYTHSGREYADFSVGIFQMKPSFVEALEEKIRNSKSLRELFPECIFSGEDIMLERRDRLKRLQDPVWQTRYLIAFGEIMKERFGDAPNNPEDRLVLFATAYNSGFKKTTEEIKVMAEKELFPRFSRTKYNYSKLSLWFYNQLTNELINERF